MPDVNVQSHHVRVVFYVQISDQDLRDTQFPFPIETEAGTILQTEAGIGLAIEGGTAVAIPLVGGVVPPQILSVVGDE